MLKTGFTECKLGIDMFYSKGNKSNLHVIFCTVWRGQAQLALCGIDSWKLLYNFLKSKEVFVSQVLSDHRWFAIIFIQSHSNFLGDITWSCMVLKYKIIGQKIGKIGQKH